MGFSDVKNFIEFSNPFGVPDEVFQDFKDATMRAIKVAYQQSIADAKLPDIREMFDKLVSDSMPITFRYSQGNAQAVPSTRTILVDHQYRPFVLSDDGVFRPLTFQMILLHEAHHLIYGSSDPLDEGQVLAPSDREFNFFGSTVEAENLFRYQLGYTWQRGSYFTGHDKNSFVGVTGFTRGETVDLAIIVDRLFLSSNYLSMEDRIPTRDLLIGSNRKGDTLLGGVLDDFIWGFGGDDELNGGDGDDELFGGAGSDTYFVDNNGDLVTEKVSEGNDSVVLTGVSEFLAGHIENVRIVVPLSETFEGSVSIEANEIRSLEMSDRNDVVTLRFTCSDTDSVGVSIDMNSGTDRLILEGEVEWGGRWRGSQWVQEAVKVVDIDSDDRIDLTWYGIDEIITGQVIADRLLDTYLLGPNAELIVLNPATQQYHIFSGSAEFGADDLWQIVRPSFGLSDWGLSVVGALDASNFII